MFSPHAMDQFGKPWTDFFSSSEKQEEKKKEYFTCDQVRKQMEICVFENMKVYFL